MSKRFTKGRVEFFYLALGLHDSFFDQTFILLQIQIIDMTEGHACAETCQQRHRTGEETTHYGRLICAATLRFLNNCFQ